MSTESQIRANQANGIGDRELENSQSGHSVSARSLQAVCLRDCFCREDSASAALGELGGVGGAFTLFSSTTIKSAITDQSPDAVSFQVAHIGLFLQGITIAKAHRRPCTLF